MEEKKKMDDLKKVKLIYSGELLLFALIFLVIGILILVNVISIKDWKRIVFSYVTLIGGVWIIADFIWTLASPKRRVRKPLIDKVLVLPASLTVISFDIYAFVNGMVHSDVTSPLFAYFIGGDLCYLALVYLFECLYHYKHPLPELIEAAKEDEKKEEAKDGNQNIVDAESKFVDENQSVDSTKTVGQTENPNEKE